MKVALVTGASRGLGAEIARILFDRGFLVLAPPHADMDLGNQQSIAKMASIVGSLDVLINNAAILSENLADSLTVNAMGAYHLTRFLWPQLTKPGARVVNISSTEGVMDGDSFGKRPYSVSKAALNAITRMQANNPDGVLVNACCPGWFNSRLGGDCAARSAAEAADTPVWLATDAPAFTGKFVSNRTILPW